MTKQTWQETLNQVRAENPQIKKQTEIFKMAKERYTNQPETPSIVLNTQQVPPQPVPFQQVPTFENHPVMQTIPDLFPQPPQIQPTRRQLIRQNKQKNKLKARQYDELFRQSGYRVIRSNYLTFVESMAVILGLAALVLLYLNFGSLL